MFKVKVSLSNDWPLERQLPGKNGIWGNCHFFVNQDIEECDFWVVLEGVKRVERVRCNPQNTIFITHEPPDVRSYSNEFLSQFAAVITCNRNLLHQNIIFTQQGLQWMVGAEFDINTRTWNNFKSFDELAQPVPEKNKVLSVVLSRKNTTTGHKARARLIDLLIDSFGDAVDVFGVGYSPIKDKWDAIAPYRYHLVVENSQLPDYWTEKLSDAFIGEAFPIYSGCPNILDYFPENSLEIIDINYPDEAIRRIRQIIGSNRYLEQKNIIQNAKQFVMEKYNIFAILEQHINSKAIISPKFKREFIVRPEQPSSEKKMHQLRGNTMSLFSRLASRILGRKLIVNNGLVGVVCSGSGDNLVIGKGVSFGGNVFLFGTETIEIGDFTMIAYGVIIHTSTHDYNDHPMWLKRIDRPVKIGKHVWIGTGAIILPGVMVEDYAVVGAGSVVTANVPKGAIVVGNPARITRYRDPQCYSGEQAIIDSNRSIIIKEKYIGRYCKE